MPEVNTNKAAEKKKNSFDKTVKRHKRINKKAKAVAIVAAIIICAVGIYLCFDKLFFVKSIAVESGDKSDAEKLYTQEQLFEGLGIEKGMGLYEFDADDAEKNAKYSLPYFKEIKISRKWPSTVVAKVIPETPSFYCLISDNMYIVSDELKVLECTTDARKIEVNSLIYLKVGGIHNCIEGEKLGVEEDTEQIIDTLVQELSKQGILERITSIDVTDKFDIEMMYDTTYLVKLDDAKNLDSKIHFLTRIVEERKDASGGGTIDLSNVSKKEAKFDKFS